MPALIKPATQRAKAAREPLSRRPSAITRKSTFAVDDVVAHAREDHARSRDRVDDNAQALLGEHDVGGRTRGVGRARFQPPKPLSNGQNSEAKILTKTPI